MAVSYQDPHDTGAKLKDFGEDAIQNAGYIKNGGSSVINNNAAYGVLSPQQAQVYNQNEANVLATVGLTIDQYNTLAQTNQIPASIQQKVDSAVNTNYTQQLFAKDNHLSGLIGNLALGMSLGVATAGLGAAIGPALGASLGATGGAVATGAITGAVGTALQDAFTGQPLTAGSVGKGAAMGAVGAGAGLASKGLADATGMSAGVSNDLTKAGLGAATSALTGGNPLAGAVQGGVSSLVSGGLGAAGMGAFGGVAGGFLGNMAGSAVAGQPTGNNQMMGQGQVNPQTSQAADPMASFMSGIGSIAAPVLSGIGANNQASMQTNAYTTAGNAANSGNLFGFSGLGGMGGQYANGNLTVNGGSMNPAAGQFSQFSNTSGQMANQFAGGQAPANVTGAYGNFNNQIGIGQTGANAGAQTSAGVMGLGASTLTGANSNYNSAYNTALNSGLAALNPQIQQQSNALLNSNFARGMSGSSGGALQTQALQNSFNTANLQVQNNAVGQGLNAYNSTINAGTGMFNSGAGQMGNFINQGASLGAQGLSGAQSYSSFAPQLAGQYQANANSGVAGFSGINASALNNFQAGLGAITNQGNQANKGAQTQTLGAQQYNGGLAGYAGGVLGSPGATNNLLSGASSLFSGLTGLFGNQDPNSYGISQDTQISNNLDQQFASQGGLSGFTMPNFDSSGNFTMNNQDQPDYGLGGY